MSTTTLKQLANKINTPLGNLIKKAKNLGLPHGINSELTEQQVQVLTQADMPQLNPSQNKEPDNAPLTAPNTVKRSITTTKQKQLAQAKDAEAEQFNHQVYTALQQSFELGQEVGVLDSLAYEQGRISAKTAVSQALFRADMQRKQQQLDDLAKRMEETDFFGNYQTPQESLYKASQVSYSSNSELNQILKNLEFNPSSS